MANKFHGSGLSLVDTFTWKLILDRTTPPLTLYFHDLASQAPNLASPIPFQSQ